VIGVRPLLVDESLTQHPDAGVVSDARARQRRRRGIAAAVIGIAVAGGVTAAVVGGGSQPESHARVASESQLVITRAAEDICRSRLSAPVKRVPGAGYRGAWRTILLERRVPATLILFAETRGRAERTCLVGGQRNSGVMTGVNGNLAPAAAGTISVVGSGGGRLSPKQGSAQFSWIEGRAGPGVNRVTIRFENGQHLAARIAHGWFLAWWPGRRALAKRDAIIATAFGRPSAREPLFITP
jgi:hypothetical protein